MYERDTTIQLGEWLDRKEIVILYGARQTGKTTLIKEMLKERDDALVLNCEMPLIADTLESNDLSQIIALFEGKKIIAFDEAQKIKNIGSVLKIIYDEFPQYKLFATGSSSFELAGKLSEPLTGRNVKFKLFPLSLNEIKKEKGWLWVRENLNQLIVYGTYPGLIDLNIKEREKKLIELATDYLYKDVFMYENVRNPAVIRNLLKALALQVGSQVSSHELAGLLGVSRTTVERYLDLLEKSFVIYNLPSFNRNLRNEIKKSRKYLFFDTGIRNALLGDFRPMTDRVDNGALWENFCISQRIFMSEISQPNSHYYFWRTYDKAEIDLVEESNGELAAFEFKLKQKRSYRFPTSFVEKYNPLKTTIISQDNLHKLLDW